MSKKNKLIIVLTIITTLAVILIFLLVTNLEKTNISTIIVELPKTTSDSFVQSTKGHILFGDNSSNPGITEFIGLAKEEKWIDRTVLSKVKEYAHVQKFQNTETKNYSINIDFYRFDKEILVEKYYVDSYYGDFNSAVIFAATMLKDEIPVYKGKEEEGGKFKFYDITTREDRLKEIEKETLKQQTITTACKGEINKPNAIYSPPYTIPFLTEENLPRILAENPDFQPTVSFTEEEYLACDLVANERNVLAPQFSTLLSQIRVGLEIYNRLVLENNEKNR